VNVLVKRLEAIFADGQVDADEQAELLRLLTRISAARPLPFLARREAVPLPLTLPEPPVELAGRSFCLAGSFIYGNRTRCEQDAQAKGGLCVADPGAPADYLVIGTLSHADWQRSPEAEKIQRALRMRVQGMPLAVVSEEHWVSALETAN
jgi:hypothetical protein